jgi:hypothetical protein
MPTIEERGEMPKLEAAKLEAAGIEVLRLEQAALLCDVIAARQAWQSKLAALCANRDQLKYLEKVQRQAA